MPSHLFGLESPQARSASTLGRDPCWRAETILGAGHQPFTDLLNDKTALLQNQRHWVKQRNSLCHDIDCLITAEKQRIQELSERSQPSTILPAVPVPQVVASNSVVLLPSTMVPSEVGKCSETTIDRVRQRLYDGTTGVDIPGSGVDVAMGNGVHGVSYDEIQTVLDAKPGDQVIMCLIAVPQHCPPGDERGKIYTATDLRTLESWTLPDDEHSCGGA